MIRIVHLYPRELGINGDVGNVTALRRRAQWRGASAEVIGVGAGDALPADAHLVHVGSGPSSARRPLHADVSRHAERLRAWASDGVPWARAQVASAMAMATRSPPDRLGRRRVCNLTASRC